MLVPRRPGHAALRRPHRSQLTPATSASTTPDSIPPQPTRTLIKTLCLLVFGACGMAVLLSLLPAAGHDQLWFLLVARRWLTGATLYGPQIFDSNTPAIVWLSALAVELARALRLPDTVVAKLLVVLFEAAVARLSLRLLHQSHPRISRPHILWLAFCFVLIFAAVPARDLGQRDQLAALLCLPYLLAASIEAAQPQPALILGLAAGTLAGVGVCLKPQQALVPLAIELALLIRPASLAPTRPQQQRLASLTRPEPWALLATVAAFLLAVRLLTPLFFTLTLPLLLSTYWAIGDLSAPRLLAEAPQLHLLAAVAFAAFVTNRRRRREAHRATAILLIAATAATAAYYLQGTGWYYQQLPALSFFAAALAFELPPLARRLSPCPPAWLPAATAALVALTLVLTIVFAGLPLSHNAAYAVRTPDPAFFAALPPDTPVAILSTSVEDTMMPVARFHLTWAQRTNNLWTLPALLRNADPTSPLGVPPRHRLSPPRLAALAAQQRRWMVEDLEHWRPALVLVERCQDPSTTCQELAGRHDDLLAFFLADPAFSRLWRRHYRYLRTSPPYDAYSLASPF